MVKRRYSSSSRRIVLYVLLACYGVQTAYTMTLDVNVVNLDGPNIIRSEDMSGNDQVYLHYRSRRLYRRESSGGRGSLATHCEAVRGDFTALDMINVPFGQAEIGAICGGHCCSNATEIELKRKATSVFERLLHHHTNSLRGILESTAHLFQNHVLELLEQSENRTLNVFSQVYRRMVPLSTKLIHHLYMEIIIHLKNSNSDNSNGIANDNGIGNWNRNRLEDTIHKFFVNLFPVAYHQAVHLNKDNNGVLHEDYVNCMEHTYVDLQPFDAIPKEIKRSLLHSVQTAQMFIEALHQSAEVLGKMDELYAQYLSKTCQRQLLKMGYCPSCVGLQKAQAKPCYSYCVNVLRGCSAQYAGVLDGPWSNVVDAIDNLVTSHIRSDSGIMTTIKQLDGKLSKAIMYVMENGPLLEKKVKKTCGTPKLLPAVDPDETRVLALHNVKWSTPPDAEILRFLSTIDKSKEFYSNIVNNFCEDEDIQRNDHNCWTGDRISDYTQLVMTTGVDTQRYNPEVPLEANSQSTKLNELVDKLIKISKNIGNAVPSTMRSYSDIQSDMARHDEEGSGNRMSDDIDDEEYVHGSGDASGDEPTALPIDPTLHTDGPNRDDKSNKSSYAASFHSLSMTVKLLVALLVILIAANGGGVLII